MTTHRIQSADVRVETFGQGDAAVLTDEADAANAELYGHADETPMEASEFEASERGAFMIAYLGSEAVACGGYRRFTGDESGETAELKRLFVRPNARGTGVSATILTALEVHAVAAEYRRMVLDVGSKQPAAHRLYEKSGYHRISGFSIYKDRPGNRAYAKELA